MSLALAPLDVSVEIEANLPCRKFDPDLWFSDAPAQLELAKSLCGDCPLRVEVDERLAANGLESRNAVRLAA